MVPQEGNAIYTAKSAAGRFGDHLLIVLSEPSTPLPQTCNPGACGRGWEAMFQRLWYSCLHYDQTEAIKPASSKNEVIVYDVVSDTRFAPALALVKLLGYYTASLFAIPRHSLEQDHPAFGEERKQALQMVFPIKLPMSQGNH